MISLLCPSRGRPEQLERFACSAVDCCDEPEHLEILVYVDHDDGDTWLAARDIRQLVVPAKLRIIRGDRVILSDMWNVLARAARGEILGHMGDDIRFVSAGWDIDVWVAFAGICDRIALVYGNDLVHGERLATHGFLHRRWVEAVGYFVPPYFSHDYNDTWLTEVAQALGRRVYLSHVITEHMHPDVGKGVYDQTYLDHRAAGARDDVAGLYERLAPQRQADIEKLRSVMRDRM